MYICYKPARSIKPSIKVEKEATIQTGVEQEIPINKTSLVQPNLEQRLQKEPIPTIQTIDRRKATAPKSYERVAQLTEQKPYATKQKRIELNKQIRELRARTQLKVDNTHNQDKRYWINFTDLTGVLIGSVYSTPNPEEQTLGDTNLIKEFSFDFIALNEGGVCLKATAYLTTPGIEYLKEYIKHYIQDENIGGRRSNNKNTRSRKSKLKAKRIIKKRSCYEIRVNDTRAHVNLQGKIGIFVPYKKLEQNLVDQTNLNPLEQERLKRFTRYSPLKKWIKTTDAELNQLVTASLTSLSQVVSKIFERYTAPTYF